MITFRQGLLNLTVVRILKVRVWAENSPWNTSYLKEKIRCNDVRHAPLRLVFKYEQPRADIIPRKRNKCREKLRYIDIHIALCDENSQSVQPHPDKPNHKECGDLTNQTVTS